MIVASIRRFRRQAPHTTARRILLPYSVVTLALNSLFVILAAYSEELANEDPEEHGVTPIPWTGCEPCDILERLVLTIPIVANDALLVSVFHLVSIKLYSNCHRCIVRVSYSSGNGFSCSYRLVCIWPLLVSRLAYTILAI
jgi:hypothetical protein